MLLSCLQSPVRGFACAVKAVAESKEEGAAPVSYTHLMSLGIPTQSEITITCNGDDEDSAIAAIEEVLRAQKIIG